MLLVDDLLLAPLKSLFWIFRKVHEAAEDELESKERRARSDLSELYMQLETGRITEQEFESREKELLDRLDALQKARAPGPPEAPREQR